MIWCTVIFCAIWRAPYRNIRNVTVWGSVQEHKKCYSVRVERSSFCSHNLISHWKQYPTKRERPSLILQGRLIAPFFVWRVCSCSGLLVRIPGLFCVRGVLRILIERKLSNLSALLFVHRQICSNFRERDMRNCAKLWTASQKRPVEMRHSLISPVKLHVFVGSKRHQKMRMCVIQGCANLWSTSMSFIWVTCDAARGLQCPKQTCKRRTGWKLHYGMVFQIPEETCDQSFHTFPSGNTETRLREHSG